MIDQIQFYEVRTGILRQRHQKKVSITKEQQEYVRLHYGKKTILQLSIDTNVPFGKLHSNMRVMGLVKRRETDRERNYLIWRYTK